MTTGRDPAPRDPRPYYDALPEPKASRFELGSAVGSDARHDFDRRSPAPLEYDRRILLVSLTSAGAALVAGHDAAERLRGLVRAMVGDAHYWHPRGDDGDWRLCTDPLCVEARELLGHG